MRDHELLFQDQIAKWPLAAANYQALEKILIKDFDIDGVHIRLQCNPSRITSAAANISKTTIKERPCFLCAKNRPAEQAGLAFKTENKVSQKKDDFIILVNPFPVFPKHFTIAGDHQPQTIKWNFDNLLQIARQMDDCVVFYNGPRCGASAPDHIHFQAGSKGLIPLETNYGNWKKTNVSLLLNQDCLQLYSLRNMLRGGWLLEGTDETDLTQIFYSLLKALEPDNAASDEEPMLNILCWHSDVKWICIIFPRKAHRPSCYFRQDESKLLISPASVEMGGLIVAARPEDFKRINANDIKEIYYDVSFSEQEVEKVSNKISIKS
jgi:ATP adenylyltransferase/5',5'''-P-1,P-4-tetraphosphate phosphorylase II